MLRTQARVHTTFVNTTIFSYSKNCTLTDLNCMLHIFLVFIFKTDQACSPSQSSKNTDAYLIWFFWPGFLASIRSTRKQKTAAWPRCSNRWLKTANQLYSIPYEFIQFTTDYLLDILISSYFRISIFQPSLGSILIPRSLYIFFRRS